jgi:RNA polymerase primary sigma factor
MMYSIAKTKSCGLCSKPGSDHDIAKRRGLSPDEEYELAGLIANGDRGARDRLVEANLGLVVKLAARFMGRGLDREDLIGEGNLGLIQAATEFDPTFRTRFCTYAAYWIKQRICFALINTAPTIRVPDHMFRLLSKWCRAEAMLTHLQGRRPSFEEVASVLLLSPAQTLMAVRAHAARQLKLMSSYDGNSGYPSCDQVWDRPGTRDDRADSEDEWVVAVAKMKTLEAREREILALRFGFDGEILTLVEIGRRYGITREWVRKIEIGALRKLGRSRND